MRLNEIIEARSTINAHANEKVSAQLAYKFAKFIKATQDEIDFYVKKCNEIIQKYGDRDDDGKLITNDESVKIKEEYIEECNQAMNELYNVEIEQKCDFTFTIRDLREINMSTTEMKSLLPFITE